MRPMPDFNGGSADGLNMRILPPGAKVSIEKGIPELMLCRMLVFWFL